MADQTSWFLRGTGYEFCNCDFGCGCNFGGFPNSKDGSCRALVAVQIAEGRCGEVSLAGVTCAALLSWPKAIHEGQGTAVFVVDPSTSEAQAGALGQIFTGALGGLPWGLLGPTFSVAGLERAPISVTGSGVDMTVSIPGIAEARGESFRNPVSGEKHQAHIDLPDGFIWTRGECGQGTFRASAGPVDIAFDKTNWIKYAFDWSNAPVPAVA